MAHACTGLKCNFYDRSVDPDGTVASRGWVFSNGVTSTLKSASHTFAAGGTYTVQLSVTDNGGKSATTSRSVTVSALPPTSITLTAAPYLYSGSMRVYLAWTGATSTNVDIYRNGVLRATTANGGTHTDILGSTVSGTYAFRVCAAGTTTCSNTVNVVF